jgi:uncharacterized protein (DUF305 family)
MTSMKSRAIVAAAAVTALCALTSGSGGAGTPSFDDALMGSMSDMDRAMQRAPMNGDPDHDFASMMIAHHRGAIAMAVVELRYGRDRRLQRLAQEIIVTQRSEIDVMQSTLHDLAKGNSHER